MDVESLQSSGRRGTSCLNVFLVGSVITLFLAVAALAAGGMMVMMELRSKDLAPQYQKLMEPQQQEEPLYKMGNFLSLEFSSSVLDNSTIHWSKFNYGNGTSVGRNYKFDEQQGHLKPVQEGSYFIFLELKLRCTFTCKKGLLIVRIGDKLTCEVTLEENQPSVRKMCWTVTQLHKENIFAQMTFLEQLGTETNWELDLGSRMGMFFVD